MIFLKNFNFVKTVKSVFLSIGIFISLIGIALLFVSNFNIGNFLTIFFGLIIVLLVIFWSKLAKSLKTLGIAVLILVTVMTSSLIIYGKNDTATYNENAVIVLGAAVHGTTPSLTLKRRLDKTVEFYKNNTDAVIVVSGGKGAQEDISEAEAMKIYLTEHGVPEKNIIKEEKATSTFANFEYSKQILDEKLGENYTVSFITNEYHIFRAKLCAESAGIENATHYHCNTNLSYLLSGVLRECLAVVKYFIFKR